MMRIGWRGSGGFGLLGWDWAYIASLLAVIVGLGGVLLDISYDFWSLCIEREFWR